MLDIDDLTRQTDLWKIKSGTALTRDFPKSMINMGIGQFRRWEDDQGCDLQHSHESHGWEFLGFKKSHIPTVPRDRGWESAWDGTWNGTS